MDQPRSQFISQRWGRSRAPSFSVAMCGYRHPPGCWVRTWLPGPGPVPLCGGWSQSPSTSRSSALSGAWAKALGLSQLLSCITSAFSPLLISPVEENNTMMCVLACIHLRRLCVVFPYSEAVLVFFYSSSTPSKKNKVLLFVTESITKEKNI